MTSSAPEPTLPPREPSALRTNLRLGTLEGILAVPFVYLITPGNLILAALVTQFFGVDAVLWGTIVSLPYWCNAAQLLLMPMLTSRYSARAINLVFSWANVAAWMLLVGALLLVPPDNAAVAGLVFFLGLLLVSFTHSLVGVGWLSWAQEWAPTRLRGSYFGARNRFISFATFAFLAVTAASFAFGADTLWPYLGLLAAAGLFRVGSIVLQHRIRLRPTPGDDPPAAHTRWRDQIGQLAHTPRFRRFLVFGAMTGFGFGFLGPYVPLFMYETLQVPVAEAILLALIATTAGAIASPFWGRLCSRYGARLCTVIGLAAWESTSWVWIFLTPETTWLLYFTWAFGGAMAAGYLIGSMTLLLKLLHPSFKTTGVSVNLAVTSIAGALGPLVSAQIVLLFGGTGEEYGLVYRVLFFLRLVLIYASCRVLWPLHEPEITRTASMMGAMRSVRQMVTTQGLGTMANQTLSFRRKRKLRRVKLQI